MKRQIIKTRSDTPYRIARIIIGIVAVVLAGWLTYAFWWAPAHAVRAGAASMTHRQDFPIFPRNPKIPIDLS